MRSVFLLCFCLSNIPGLFASHLVGGSMRYFYDSTTYTIAYQRCCFSTVYGNLIDPGDTGLTLQVSLTPYARLLKNSSPLWPDAAPVLPTGVDVFTLFPRNAAWTNPFGI